MELIPILSLIVLVATISTFILAVGAYVLYKIRERKGRIVSAPAPSAIEAELITPAPLMAEQKNAQRSTRTAFTNEQYQTRSGDPLYQRQQARRTNSGRPPMRPTILSVTSEGIQESRFTRELGDRRQRRQTTEQYPTDKKYMRYTKNGYEEPKKVEKKNEDKLRWR